MADPQKGTSAASVEQKKASPLDDEIGNDFLTSWKLTTNASDALDFNVSETSGKGKMKFDFNKLDDFEFGGDFDKMLSFKMDMSDLDFASSSKKPEKMNEKSGKDSLLGKKDRNSDTFSFNFDFNELEGFGLETNLLKDGKSENDNKRKCENDHKGLTYLSKRERNNDSRSNSATSTDKVCRNMNRLDDTTSSNSEHSIGNQKLDIINNAVMPSASNLKCYEALSPLNKQGIAGKRNDNDGNEKKVHNETSEIPGLVNQFAEKDNRVCSIQSKDMSLSENYPQVETEVHDSDSIDPKADSVPNKDAKGMCSPDSRGSSSANTHGPCLSIAADKLQEHSDDQNDKSSVILSKNRSNEVVKNVDDPPISIMSSKLGSVTKSGGNIWKSSIKVLQSSLQREFYKSIEPNAKDNDVLQSKPQRAPLSFEYPHYSVSCVKTTDLVSSQKMEKSCASFTDEKRISVRGPDKTVLMVGSSKLFSGNTTKQELLIPDSDEKQNDISNSIISKRAATLISPLSTIPKTGAFSKKIKTSPLHKPGLSFTIAGGICDKTNLKNLRPKQPSRDLNKTVDQRKSNLIRISDEITERQSMATPMALQADVPRKFTSLSPSLKRKSFEETNARSVISKPLKRVSESPTQKRQLYDSSPKLSGQVVPGIENMECSPNGASLNHQNSPVPLTFEKSMMDITDPTLLENDGTVQMAESCSKELDDICKMLKKKHEEAKELLVRVMVNNNSLLMLNHPMLDEKISSCYYLHHVLFVHFFILPSWRACEL